MKNVRKMLIVAAVTGALVTVSSAATANADVVGMDPNLGPAGPALDVPPPPPLPAPDVPPPPAPDVPPPPAPVG
ncbi:resuscitation-promoting factor RpfE, partial [Mycobacterium haemophilum]